MNNHNKHDVEQRLARALAHYRRIVAGAERMLRVEMDIYGAEMRLLGDGYDARDALSRSGDRPDLARAAE